VLVFRRIINVLSDFNTVNVNGFVYVIIVWWGPVFNNYDHWSRLYCSCGI